MPQRLLRHVIAVAITGVAGVANALLWPEIGARYPLIAFFPAIAVSSWIGGFWPGLVSTALSILAAAYFWYAPPFIERPSHQGEFIILAMFVAIGLTIACLFETVKRRTERAERLANELRVSQERFRLAVEAAPAAMIMMDERGTIVLANALTEQVLGYDRRELVGLSIERLIPTGFGGRHSDFLTQFLADAQSRPMGRELYAARRDGVKVPVEIGLSPIKTDEGTFVLAAVTDISDRKHIEAQRAGLLERETTARAAIERASQLKDEFLAVLSHELRTPLSAVLGYANLLSSGSLSAERVQHAIGAIQRNAQTQAHLIESLLDLSRIMAGKLELDRERISLRAVLTAAIDVVRPAADAKGIDIAIDMPASEVMLVGDSGRLQQVLWNLLSNAVKFTPRNGRVELRVAADEAHVRIVISDNGCGIGSDFLPHVFERFRQAVAHRHRTDAGLGLGLAVVHEIVRAHDGTVIAESADEGLGSTFTVTLPSGTPLPTGQPFDPHMDEACASDPLPRTDVLIVGDDRDVRTSRSSSI